MSGSTVFSLVTLTTGWLVTVFALSTNCTHTNMHVLTNHNDGLVPWQHHWLIQQSYFVMSPDCTGVPTVSRWANDLTD